MKTCRFIRHSGRACAFAAMLAVFALSGCAPLPTAPVNPQPGWIGHITSIEGPNAFVDPRNTGAARPARVGETLLPGDRFFTGDGTRMKVDFASGGYVELDENTDPSLFQDLSCLVISLFRSGRIFVDKAAACVESLDTKSIQQSKVAYEVMRGGSYVQITVVEGQARTVVPPGAQAPARGWRIDVTRRGVLAGGAYRVSEEEVRNTISWTRYYRDTQQPRSGLPFGISIGIGGFGSSGDRPRPRQPEGDRWPGTPR